MLMQIKFFNSMVVFVGAFILHSCVFAFSIADAEISYVMGNHERSTLKLLRKNLKNDLHNQQEINKILFNSTGCGYQKVVSELINLPNEQIRPNQIGINESLYEAVRSDRRSIVRIIINQPEGQLRPNQTAVNKAFFNATRDGNQALIEFFLNRPYGQLQPDQQGMHASMMVAAIYGRIYQLEWFLNIPSSNLRPSQNDINRVLPLVAGEGFSLIVEFLLSRPEGYLRPDQNSIIRSYHEAIARIRPEVIAIIEPRVPINERQETLPLARIGESDAVLEFNNFAAVTVNTEYPSVIKHKAFKFDGA